METIDKLEPVLLSLGFKLQENRDAYKYITEAKEVCEFFDGDKWRIYTR